jgi:hypothetical protein
VAPPQFVVLFAVLRVRTVVAMEARYQRYRGVFLITQTDDNLRFSVHFHPAFNGKVSDFLIGYSLQ